LFVIYSGDRMLTDREREFVSLLRMGLMTGIGDIGQAPEPLEQVRAAPSRVAALH
jgi:hypothetical protein